MHTLTVSGKHCLRAVILELAREFRGTKATTLGIYTSTTTRWFVAPRHSRACPVTGWRNKGNHGVSSDDNGLDSRLAARMTARDIVH